MINEELDDNEQGIDIDLYYLFGVLWRYKKTILSITFVAGVLSIIYVLNATKFYMSQATIYPITKDQGGPLKEIAASLGLGVKPEGYYLPEVIKSRRISKKIITTKYKIPALKDSITLLQYWDLDKLDESDNMKMEYGITLLTTLISIKENKETALIDLKVITKVKELSSDIVQAYMDEITYYLQNELKTQIKESIFFTNNRLDQVKEELIRYEDDLLEFREKNTRATSPYLIQETNRMVKKILLTEDVELLLKKQLELLKIEEQRTKPVMNVLDKPDLFEKPVRPKKKSIVVLNTFLAFILSYVAVLLKEKAERGDVIKKIIKELKSK